MITLKFKYHVTCESAELIRTLRRQYSCVLRSAYNRFSEDKLIADVRSYCAALNNIENLNSWLRECAVQDGKAVYVRVDNENKKIKLNADKIKVVFGGKKLAEHRLKNQISNEEYKHERMSKLCSQGERLYRGNRMFDFSRLNENILIFKLDRLTHITLQFNRQRKNYRKKLEYVQLAAANKEQPISVRLSATHIYISYEELKLSHAKSIDTRYMGIDMNPNHIGLALFDGGKIIKAMSFDLISLTSKIINESNISESNRAKYLNNKLNYETVQIAKQICAIAKTYQIKYAFLEDLNKIHVKKKGGSNYGKKYNRLTHNIWKRREFSVNLKKRLNLVNIKSFDINAMYTSVIGNMQHEYFDPCSASCEIARRGYDVIILKNKKFYPAVTVKNSVIGLWKKHGLELANSWKEISEQIKNAEIRYRVPLRDEHVSRSLQMKSRRSRIVARDFILNL